MRSSLASCRAVSRRVFYADCCCVRCCGVSCGGGAGGVPNDSAVASTHAVAVSDDFSVAF